MSDNFLSEVINSYTNYNEIIDKLIDNKIVENDNFLKYYTLKDIKNYLTNIITNNIKSYSLDIENNFIDIIEDIKNNYEEYQKLVERYKFIKNKYSKYNKNNCEIFINDIDLTLELHCIFNSSEIDDERWDVGVNVENDGWDLNYFTQNDNEEDQILRVKSKIKFVKDKNLYLYRNVYFKEGKDLVNISDDFDTQMINLIPLEIVDIIKKFEIIKNKYLIKILTNKNIKNIIENYNLLKISKDTLLIKTLMEIANYDVLIELGQKYKYIGNTLLNHYSILEIIEIIIYNMYNEPNIPDLNIIKKYLNNYNRDMNYKELVDIKTKYDLTQLDLCCLCELSDEYNPGVIEHECSNVLCRTCSIESFGKCPMCRGDIKLSPESNEIVTKKKKVLEEEKQREIDRQNLELIRQLQEEDSFY